MLAGSFWRKAVLTLFVVIGFVYLYEVTIPDARFSFGLEGVMDAAETPQPGSRLAFTTTAYCKGAVTSSGVPVQSGIAAADPSLLPIGSVLSLRMSDGKYDGVYTVLDTGPAVQGRELDIYMWNCNEALAFGRRTARVTILRLGWNPQANTPTFMDRFFKKPQAAPVIPSRPLPQIEMPQLQ